VIEADIRLLLRSMYKYVITIQTLFSNLVLDSFVVVFLYYNIEIYGLRLADRNVHTCTYTVGTYVLYICMSMSMIVKTVKFIFVYR
jgi:hypothetical protein